MLAQTLLVLGEFPRAREHAELGLAVYEPQLHRPQVTLVQQDPGVTCLVNAAQVEIHNEEHAYQERRSDQPRRVCGPQTRRALLFKLRHSGRELSRLTLPCVTLHLSRIDGPIGQVDQISHVLRFEWQHPHNLKIPSQDGLALVRLRAAGDHQVRLRAAKGQVAHGLGHERSLVFVGHLIQPVQQQDDVPPLIEQGSEKVVWEVQPGLPFQQIVIDKRGSGVVAAQGGR